MKPDPKNPEPLAALLPLLEVQSNTVNREF